MNESRIKILQMVADKKISADEAEQLLSLLDRESTARNETGAGPQSFTPNSSGKRETRYAGFTRVEAHSAVDADVTQGAEFSVEIFGADSRDVDISQDGETLKIRRPGYFGFGWWGNWGVRPKIKITMPEIKGVVAQGASYIKIQGFRSENELSLVASGASRIKLINLLAGSFSGNIVGASSISGDIVAKGSGYIYASGASHARLGGSTRNLTLRLNGASNVKMGEFTAGDVDAHFTGACNANINVTGRLDANLTGASNLHYSGSPVMGNIVTMGASHLNHTTAPPMPPAPPVFS